MVMDSRGQKHMPNENYGPFFKGQYSGPDRESQLLVLILMKLRTDQNMEFQNQLFGCQLFK
jgi:hypothetical protein